MKIYNQIYFNGNLVEEGRDETILHLFWMEEMDGSADDTYNGYYIKAEDWNGRPHFIK